MLLYAVIHVATFSILSLIIYFAVRPRVRVMKKTVASMLFYLGIVVYGGLFPLAYDYVYAIFRKGFFGYAFILTGVYGVFLLTTAGWRFVTMSGRKNYHKPHNPFLFMYSGYGLLILIGCAITMVWVGQYVPMFE
jgi:hypothetical protein